MFSMFDFIRFHRHFVKWAYTNTAGRPLRPHRHFVQCRKQTGGEKKYVTFFTHAPRMDINTKIPYVPKR